MLSQLTGRKGPKGSFCSFWADSEQMSHPSNSSSEFFYSMKSRGIVPGK